MQEKPTTIRDEVDQKNDAVKLIKLCATSGKTLSEGEARPTNSCLLRKQAKYCQCSNAQTDGGEFAVPVPLEIAKYMFEIIKGQTGEYSRKI